MTNFLLVTRPCVTTVPRQDLLVLAVYAVIQFIQVFLIIFI